MKYHTVDSIGINAFKVWQLPGDYSVVGKTSKGCFLKHPGNQIVFLSREAYRGPYTITLDDPSILEDMQETMVYRTERGLRINWSSEITFGDIQPWVAPDLDRLLYANPHRNIASEVGRLASTSQPSELPVACLENLGNWVILSQYKDERWSGLFQNEININDPNLASKLTQIQGYGRGLTPSGDDFLLGISLGYARYNKLFFFSKEFLEILRSLSKSSDGKTTLVSINLLHAALDGQADERLILAFDGFISNSMNAAQIYSMLKTWGNSSGLDAFSGLCWLLEITGSYSREGG